MTAPPLVARIRSLHVYPVKSCRGIDLAAAPLAARGLAWDRQWMVVNGEGRFLTQRTHPQLATVAVAITHDQLLLEAGGRAPLAVSLAAGAASTAVRTVTVWKDAVLAEDCGDAAAAWFTRLLGTAARLVRATEATDRQPEPRWRGTIAAPVNFADGFPLLVCNAASLDDLAARLRQPAELPMNRFRPNVVVEGLPAWREDSVFELANDDVTLRLAKPCTRCVITTRDQHSGAAGSDPLPVLRELRYDRELKGVTFGWNAVFEHGVGATLRVGQELRLRLRAPPGPPEMPAPM